MLRHWLATPADQARQDWLKRFDPRFWTVDFPRPMMAAATTPAPGTLRIDLSFLATNDLAGLIWESVDRWDHPLTSYATSRDYRGCVLGFRWQSDGVLPLDAVNGPTLTIEGRDAVGTPRTWYVRLWNYAAGTPTDAVVTLDFDALATGFGRGGEAVFAGDIDRLFLSLVPVGYTGAGGPLPARLDASVTLSDVACDGPGSVLQIGDTAVPPHGLRIATGYDDAYNLTPARLVRGIAALGYREWVDHYVGMSHFMPLRWDAAAARFVVDPALPLNAPAAAWHRDFAARLAERGFRLIVSQSFELFDAYAPDAWKQRDAAANPALTGWVPPSTLLSPVNAEAQAWLAAVATAFVGIAVAAGLSPHHQIGEPWWWVGGDGRPCFYDAATVAAYPAETGRAVPPPLTSVAGALPAEQQAYLDWLGLRLGAATLALRDAVRAAVPGVRSYLLFYAPQVLAAATPDLPRANLPAAWAAPAFDALQLEDYDFVTGGNLAAQVAARAAITERLRYDLARQHYFAGFVAAAADAATDWPRIVAAAAASLARGTAETFVWAWPQVARDGVVAFDLGEDPMPAFHDVLFPLAIGLKAGGGPEFATQIATSSSGYEQRNANWSDARLRFDAGVGVRSDDDLRTLLAFFRARRGRANGFRFTDPFDSTSRDDGGAVTATDQRIGTGDGVTTRFALTKTYGADAEPYARRITRPQAATVVVAVDGAATAAWTAGDLGTIDFAAAPAAGSAVTAGFHFDVPARFDTDRIDVTASGWRSGDVPSVPLIELREA
ncbi:MAG: DUF2460 domain-containing protein [Sphingomonadaceae bacterium]|nr:DUF2460 domain-containing protein [Sphingomonadaceae bacterium]